MSDVKENKNYVTAEYLKKIAQDVKFIKEKATELLQLKADSVVLDVGCGPATDTIAYSGFISDKGKIVGIDNDPAMIEKANQELAKQQVTKNVKHLVGDVRALPFKDGEFNRIHAERLFQVLPQSINPKNVFAEMNRVLQSGGRMVLADADWASASVDFSDNKLERRLLDFFAVRMRPNGFAGRQLFGFLKAHNYSDVTVEVFPFIHRDFSETAFSSWLTQEALNNKVASEQELDTWNQELTSKTSGGSYLSYVNMVMVAGTKP
jgi:ubiquinone/menaquinone biosynthesis C-methylase UbiE